VTISVIIPTLNESARIAQTLIRVRLALPDAEIIIADGGSGDDTVTIARGLGAHIVAAPRGRGRQLIAGAGRARGEILLFLHADTWLPSNTAAVVDAALADDRTLIGSFRLSFDTNSRFLRLCGWLTRFDSVFTRFGDQAIVIRRDFYDRLGGFPAWPLFEDVELLSRARRETKIVSFPASVTTSARRFQQGGLVRQQFRNAWLLLRFLAGVPPHRLAREYPAAPLT
jgi:rSAM/selenodomain-associated transferase 2